MKRTQRGESRAKQLDKSRQVSRRLAAVATIVRNSDFEATLSIFADKNVSSVVAFVYFIGVPAITQSASNHLFRACKMLSKTSPSSTIAEERV